LPWARPTSFSRQHFAVGPPYLAHRSDMARIVDSWTTFVPKVFAGYPHLIAEMYAYSMAAAHEQLPHLQLDSYMLSNVLSPTEGWAHVDALPEVCVPPKQGIYYEGDSVPTLLHNCKTYGAGGFRLSKRWVPEGIFSCNHPMFLEPPFDLGHSTYAMENNKRIEKDKLSTKRSAFQLCVFLSSFNAALNDYKQHMCVGQTTSYAKTYQVVPR